MSNVLILGANGGIARHATALFLKETQARLTLGLRNAARLKNTHPERMRIIECDVLDVESLKTAMAGQDVVYANLAGDLERMARNIVKAMDATGLKRLIFISSMGIYDEVPGEKYGSILEPYRRAAAVIEASDLDYTILRPAWFTHDDETDYQTTQKGQPFKGSQVSRKSVAALVVKLAETPGLEVRRSLGVSKPG
ncbi:NAD-dependent epimerase/dehydratase family protein [Corallococcus sp. CA047B]|uniref:NAD(P)H-binding protein n=1 Tax=Corallococcus sp. CA047B TaxID=2316729 RepID=UPI000EA0D4F3|nr:NAD(P)H-binding protein [Corallococcus sp. CA047B]RKH16111.1 NAD-dependent epimerase/dehydratase family protein [Corallococcus sp. CA047B]